MGGGKGGGSSHTPYEAPNNLESAQYLKVVDILCEGPIGTDVSLKNILLDGTPIQREDGEFNFKGVKVSYLSGLHDQGILKGFDQISRVKQVGARIKHDTPLTRTISDPRVDSVRLVFALGALQRMTDQGDRLESTVELQVNLIKDGRITHSDWVRIDGKTTTQYTKDLLLEDLPEAPFDIQVKRITEDAKTDNVQNKTYWSVYVENTDTAFTYPDTVVVGLEIDSALFGGKVPVRTYLTKWQMVQIPTNYNPENREYTGLWDGTFKLDWTDNPAWIMYDICTNKRYGLGEKVGNRCDKWALYEIARYCDEIVPDGFGGHEPRFTCNVAISDQREAKSIIDDLASCFRGIAIWTGTELTFSLDGNKDPVALFTNSNVVDGIFNYSSAEKNTIFTAAHVQYMDKSNGYQDTTEYVANEEAIARYGLNVKQFKTFGCTSRGQAARAGRWMIETSIRERQLVNFKTGMEGFCLLPWDIIQIADTDYAGIEMHARIINVNDNTITIDREFENPVETGDVIHYLTAEGMTSCQVVSVHQKEITLNRSVANLNVNGVITISRGKIKPRLFRVIGIKEDHGTYAVQCVQHDPDKEKVVDQGMTFNHSQTLQTLHEPVLYGTTAQKQDDGLVVSWQGMNAHEFIIKLYRNNELYRSFIQDSPQVEFKNLPNGNYRVEIIGRNVKGQLSEPLIQEWQINYNLQGLKVTPELFAITLNWTNPSLILKPAAVEIYRSQTNNQNTAELVATIPLPGHTFTQNGVKLNETHHFWLRVKDSDSNTGDFIHVEGQCSHDTSAIVESINGQVTKTVLAQSLIDSLQADLDGVLDQAKQAVQNAKNNFKQEIDELKTQTSGTTSQIRKLQQVIIDKDRATTQGINNLETQVGNVKANINDLSRTVTDNQNATSQRITALTTKVDNFNPDNLIKHTLDLGHLSSDLWYPVVTSNLSTVEKSYFRVSMTLWSSFPAVSWSSHSSHNFSLLCEWTSNGSGWGTISISRDVTNFEYGWVSDSKSPIINLSQMTNSSQEVFYLRGGAQYWVYSPKDITVTLEPNGYEKDLYGYKQKVSPISYNENLIPHTTQQKLSSTYTIKAETIQGNRKALAGITLGATDDGQTAESSVIVMADKFGVVKNTSDGTVKNLFSIVNDKTAINGDLIADGTIQGRHIQASASLSSPNINGGSIYGNTITGSTIRGNYIDGGTINGTTINGGVIRGARIEGLTGKFTGELEVTQLVGGNIFEAAYYNSKGTGYRENMPPSYDRFEEHMIKLYISRSSAERILMINGRASATHFYSYEHGVSSPTPHDNVRRITVATNFYKMEERIESGIGRWFTACVIPAHAEGEVRVSAMLLQGNFSIETKLFINSNKTLRQIN